MTRGRWLALVMAVVIAVALVPFADAAEVLVAMFRVDGHGEVRWARRVAG